MINQIFDVCVYLLVTAAGWLGISYEAINVWVFVIVWPVVILGLIAALWLQHRCIRQLQQPRS